MSIFIMNKFIILILILEILKKIIVNNYYLKNIFFKLAKINHDQEELFNWLYNLFLFLSVLSLTIICSINFIIFLPFDIIWIFLIPLIIFNVFFLILINFLSIKKYVLTKIINFFFYLILIFTSYETNYLKISLSEIYLINIIEILIVFLFSYKSKLNFRIKKEYIKDFRNLFFIKKMIKYSYKSQIYYLITALILILCLVLL